MNCSYIDSLCTECGEQNGAFICSNCTRGYVVMDDNLCVAKCGDGIFINGTE